MTEQERDELLCLPLTHESSHRKLDFIIQELFAMSDMFSTSLANLAAADAALKAEVSTVITDLAAQAQQIATLTAQLSTSSAPTADQIAAIQAVADDMQASTASMQAAVSAPSSTGTTTSVTGTDTLAGSAALSAGSTPQTVPPGASSNAVVTATPVAPPLPAQPAIQTGSGAQPT